MTIKLIRYLDFAILSQFDYDARLFLPRDLSATVAEHDHREKVCPHKLHLLKTYAVTCVLEDECDARAYIARQLLYSIFILGQWRKVGEITKFDGTTHDKRQRVEHRIRS